MAATWAVSLLLIGYFSESAGTVCSISRRSTNSSYYKRIYHMAYMSCSNACCGSLSTRHCCILSSEAANGLKIAGGSLAVILLLVLACYLVYSGCKTRSRQRSRRRRVTRSLPRPIVTSSGISRGIEPGYGEKPITHYPMPPHIIAKYSPPPYDSSDPSNPPGQSSNGGQINTRTLPPGTIRPPPTAQAPPSEAPPQSDNLPMLQTDPLKRSYQMRL